MNLSAGRTIKLRRERKKGIKEACDSLARDVESELHLQRAIKAASSEPGLKSKQVKNDVRYSLSRVKCRYSEVRS